ncbi:hypothetical protein BOTBODRAFT_64286 [Botryobasidium botryosum FD-172 SS1]|uniref:Nitronate monooxygenase domain-containing protein n=1 Tax=Botryobasidium botryosum (strain FD-172 SS1) TaxID=930990 RepID=A0A067N0G3_BOTB1|nr:hypothetical protein BOTBODRAFT_64286 [Botryobasidium botryosum FD-172 SS1]
MNTKLTRLLSIKLPVVSAPMYYASTPAMAAAATGAGAFGFIAAGFTASDALVEELQTIRKALNVGSEDPVSAGVGFLGWILDMTEGSDDPRLPVVLAERPAAIWFAFGLDLGKYIAQVRAYDASRTHKTTVFVIVNSVDEALKATHEWGVDVLVVQGNEAGGHGRGDAPVLFTLLPAVLAAIPSGSIVIAAGGISTGSQIAALLTMGADGVVLGSRLLCTPECMYPESHKKVILESKFTATVRSDAFDEVNRTAYWPSGINGRAIANDIIKDAHSGLDLETRLKQYDESQANGETNRLLIWAGEGIAFVNDAKTTKDIITELYDEAISVMKKKMF